MSIFRTKKFLKHTIFYKLSEQKASLFRLAFCKLERKIMKLDIYENKNVIKTYETDKYSLMFGTIQEFIKIINLDELKSTSEEEIGNLVLKAIPNSIDLISHLMKDIFNELTDDELKNVKLKDIATVIIEVIKYAINEMTVGINSKN